MATTYVDQITGYGETVAYKAPCRVATTANIALSGLQTVDGVSLAADDRVLVRAQTNEVDNGIWIASTGAWTRARDFDSNRDITKGTRLTLTDGSTLSGKEYMISSANPIAVGTDNITFIETLSSDAGSSAAAAEAAQAAAEAAAANAGIHAAAAANSVGALPFVFSTATADSDPGAGIFRLNHATVASATAAYIDNVDADGSGVSAIIDSWDDSTSAIRGELTVRSKADATIRHVFRVTGSVVDGTGYRKLTLAYVGGSGSLTNTMPCWLVFDPKGDAGDMTFAADVLDEDDMASDSATHVPTQRSVKAYANHVINPKWYGVVGDGSADDAAAFQACVTAAAGRVIWIDGLTIRIPTGNEITVPATGLCLRGRGKIVYEGTGSLFKAGTFTTTTYPFVATAAQTVFTAADDYEGAYVEVYQEGVLRPFWTHTITHSTTDITVTFLTGGAALNDDVEIRVTRATASGLDAYSQVTMGSGVEIQTTQANAGRAFQLAWPDTGFLPGRQYTSFVMEQGAIIRGATGDDGFTNAIWLHGAYNCRFSGDIYGIGANRIPTGAASDQILCQWAVYLTGEWTSSDFRFYGGTIGQYCNALGSLFSTIEGVMITNFTFLGCGYAVYWEARSDDVGLQLAMHGCHANVQLGVAWCNHVSQSYIMGNDFFQSPISTKQFFRYLSYGVGNEIVIEGNTFRSFVTGANTGAVVARNGCSQLRGQNNFIKAADSTSVCGGFTANSGAADCTWGPNTYEHVDTAVDVQSGSSRIGVLAAGDVFITPPGVNPRYQMNGSNWWIDKKWLVLTAPASATSIANNTGTTVAIAASRNPEGVTVASNLITVPAGRTRMQVEGRFIWASNATGVRSIRVLLSPSTETSAKSFEAADTIGTTVNGFGDSIDLAVTAGQQYLVSAFQNSGGALNLNASELRVAFS